jgi:hypothetical protein
LRIYSFSSQGIIDISLESIIHFISLLHISHLGHIILDVFEVQNLAQLARRAWRGACAGDGKRIEAGVRAAIKIFTI